VKVLSVRSSSAVPPDQHCASADAATGHWRPHQPTVVPSQRMGARIRFAVPGWTDEQPRYWLNNASTDPDSG
jgi:hypothetical protein